MFYPSTLPDEIHEGYYGRLVRINALPEKDQKLLSIVREQLPAIAFPNGPPLMVEILAYSANMAMPEFVRLHTLQPYRRAIASHKPELVHGDQNDLSMIRYSAGRLARPGAYLCCSCVEQDVKHIGVSYWRRTHQIPGVYVCPEHGRALRYMEGANAFLYSPSMFVEVAHVVNEQWAVENDEHPAVRNFLNLSILLASGERPFDLKIVRGVLAQQAKRLGLYAYARSSSEYLSDRIVSIFPGQWLETIFPGITAKPVGTKVDQIDGVLYLSTSSSSVAAYLLAIFVLFDSIDEALDAFEGTQKKGSAAHERTTAEPTVNHQVDLRAEYIRTKGSHLRIARENGIELHTVINGLREVGLPNLTVKGKYKERLFEAAANFYVHGCPLVQSAIDAGVSLEDLERVVRHAGADLYAALKKMMRVSGTTRADAPLGVNQLPHLIGQTMG